MTQSTDSPSSVSWKFFLVVAVVFGALFLRRVIWAPMGPGVGKPMPQLLVAGWINGPAPTASDLAGKIVVVDCWASWCGPCVASFPHLARMHQEFAPRGVVFIGLTDESAVDLPNIQAALETEPGVTWPIGYGATEPMRELGVTALPTFVLYDRSGVAVWSGHGHGALEGRIGELIDRAE